MSLLIQGLPVPVGAAASVQDMPGDAGPPPHSGAARGGGLQNIGRTVAAEIPEGASLFIGAGAAAASVAAALAGRSRLLVVTNTLDVAVALSRRPFIEVVLVGGSVRTCDGATVDHFSVEMIRRFKVDCAIIGAPALTEEGVLLGHEPEEIDLHRAIVANARRVMLVTEHSTLKQSLPVRVGHIRDIDTVVIDHLGPGPLRDLCRLHRIRVIEAGAAPPASSGGTAP